MAKTALTVALTMTVTGVLGAQSASQVRQMFEKGDYQQVVDALTPEAEPAAIYLALLSHEKLGAREQAEADARRLADMPDATPWHFIGKSAEELLDEDLDDALAAARSAVKVGDGVAESHYQLGLVLARQQNWKESAAAFDRASQINPAAAYPYYYAGLAHSRSARPDLMAVRFERFLKIAPDAPERPEVLQIMRTVRGR